MQIDPIKSELKAPRTQRLKLQCVEPLSNVAFKFNLRRYIAGFGGDGGELEFGCPRSMFSGGRA